MAITSIQAFLDVLAKSQLLTSDQLAEARDNTLLTDDAEQLARILIDQGWITGWQTEQLLAGQTKFFVGNYVLLELLGRGGMGSVYLARHTTMNREVALKIVSKKLGKDPASVERFLSEARASASLDHPNIVRAYDVGKEVDRFFIVMEFVPGHDLEELVDLDGPLPLDLAVDCIRQAAEGLAHAHGRNMVHCDIKPSNLLVSDQGVVKILDMGMARLMGNGGEETTPSPTDQRVLGTVDYMAPEQALHSPKFDHRADVYSLGCTLYFLLTGRPPFDEGSLAQRILRHQTQPPPDVRAARPDVPDDLAKICLKMMAKDPDARFQTAAEIAKLLAHWRPAASDHAAASDRPASSGINLTTVPAPVARREASESWPTAIWGLIVAGLVVVVVVGVAIAILSIHRPAAARKDPAHSTEPGQGIKPSQPGPTESPQPSGETHEPAVQKPKEPAPSPVLPDVPPEFPPEAPPKKPEPPHDLIPDEPPLEPGLATPEATPPRVDNPLAAFPRVVDLPEATKTSPHLLGPLAAPSSQTCQISLLGSAAALAGNREFLLSRGAEPTVWLVRYRNPEGLVEDVARLWLEDKSLWFAWTGARDAPVDNLRLTALRVELNGRGAVTRLGRPRTEQPLALDPMTGAGMVKLPWGPALESSALRLDILGVEGIRARPMFDPSKTMAVGSQTKITLAPRGAPRLVLQAEYAIQRRESRIEVTAYYQMPGQSIRKRLNATTLGELLGEAKLLENREKALAARLKNLKGATGRQVNLLQEQLANVRAQHKHMRNLNAFQPLVQGQVRVHFRAYLVADGLEIELATSKPR